MFSPCWLKELRTYSFILSLINRAFSIIFKQKYNFYVGFRDFGKNIRMFYIVDKYLYKQ